MDGDMMPWMLVWGLVGIALLVLAVVGLVLLVRHGAGGNDLARPDEDAPLKILRRRYAAGEIDEDDYLRRQAGLSH